MRYLNTAIEPECAIAEPHEPVHTCDDDANSGGDGECLACGARDCPYGEPLHYHHDGCPSCEEEEEGAPEEADPDGAEPNPDVLWEAYEEFSSSCNDGAWDM